VGREKSTRAADSHRFNFHSIERLGEAFQMREVEVRVRKGARKAPGSLSFAKCPGFRILPVRSL
jgi:hypothetical protein